MSQSIQINPVGKICRKNKEVSIEIDDRYGKALLGLEEFSHIIVLAWFHEHDNPKERSTLQVHPMRDREKPLTGVFATRSPVRPNLISLYICRLRSVENNIILGFIYSWTSTEQKYVLSDVFYPGYGYWMYAYYNCTLFRPSI